MQIAGIPVGDVSEIVLEGTRAKVRLRIRRDVGLREDASLTKRSESLLGDYLLDLYPGSPNAELMPEGGQIKRVIDTQGMEAIFASLSQITGDIQQVTSSLREVLGGEQGAGSLKEIVTNLIQLSQTVETTVRESSGKLESILRNFEGVSSDVRGITRDQQESIRSIVENIDVITRDTRDVLATVKKIVGSGEGDLKEGVASLKQTLSRLDTTLQNLEEVTTKVKNGEGAVGTLLADERLGQKISESIEDLSDYATRLTSLQAEVAIRTDYLIAQGQAKNTLGVRLIPKPDKYYLLEVIDDPRGVIETQVVQSNPPGTGEPVTQVQRVTKDAFKFSAQFAKRYYFATLRFGIIESSGGVGADFNFLQDNLTVKLDAFDWAVSELRYPRVRAAVRVAFLNHLFVNGGVDDILNSQVRQVGTNRLLVGRDLFFGGGLFFTDEDLKALLSVAPTP